MLSRRALFQWLLPEPPAPPPEAPRSRAPLPPSGPMIAVISPFNCLGNLACSTCSERCPIPGAILIQGNRVSISTTHCTGCGICVPLCPAPGQAILMRPT